MNFRLGAALEKQIPESGGTPPPGGASRGREVRSGRSCPAGTAEAPVGLPPGTARGCSPRAPAPRGRLDPGRAPPLSRPRSGHSRPPCSRDSRPAGLELAFASPLPPPRPRCLVAPVPARSPHSWGLPSCASSGSGKAGSTRWRRNASPSLLGSFCRISSPTSPGPTKLTAERY